MESMFTWLSGLVQGGLALALLGSFLWGIMSVLLSPCHLSSIPLVVGYIRGIMSVLLSPCHLSSIPLVVGYISNQGLKSVKQAFWVSLAFSTGILITISLIGLITALLGRMMGDIGRWGNILVAGVFFLAGLYLLEIFPINIPGMGQVNVTRKGIWAALGLGLLFGVALGPCTFAFMAPVLAITLFSPDSGVINDVSLLAAYGIGHCLVIVLAGTFTEVLRKYLKWNERSRGTLWVKRICGVLVILGGVYMLIN